MSEDAAETRRRVEALYQRLDRDAKAGGYSLNPDREFTLGLVEGLIENGKRYGYQSCPCRLADGDRREDLDIICPCDYRDPDLAEWGGCYCGLYVSEEVLAGEVELESIPERRPAPDERGQNREAVRRAGPVREARGGGLPVWRCRVCGYLCARDEPPGLCPICKVTRDRFERFW
jgi:ferredoxin-thioredoxin reductase catalytic chain